MNRSSHRQSKANFFLFAPQPLTYVQRQEQSDLSLPGSQPNSFALTALISRATNMLFRAPTRHRRKTNSICSVWQVAAERVIGLTSAVSSWAVSITSLASGIEVAQTFSKKPFRSTRGEVKSIPGKHSLLSKWSRQGRRATSFRLLIPCDKLEPFLQDF